MSVNQDYIVENGIPVSPVVKMKLQDGSTLNLLDFFYPVGTYYETSDSDFDPNTVWGGTWVQDSKGKVLVGKSDSGVFSANNNTIGNESINLTLGQLPSHSHTYNEAASVTDDTTLSISQIPKHTHIVGAHTHTIGPHSHPYDKVTGGKTDDTVLTINQIPSHNHAQDAHNHSISAPTLTTLCCVGYTSSDPRNSPAGTVNYTSNAQPYIYPTGGGQGHNHTISTESSTTEPATGGDSGTNSDFDTESSGNNSPHNHDISVVSSTTDSIGNGDPIDLIQPSKVCIRWHRTA